MLTTSALAAFLVFLLDAIVIRGAHSFSKAATHPSHLARTHRAFPPLPLARPGTAMSSGRDPSDAPPTDEGVSVRILCLHGKGGNGKQFIESSLMPLRSLVEQKVATLDLECSVSFHWDELTAPYEISPPGDGGNAGYSWWTMPPGVRSYNAQEVSRRVLYIIEEL